MILWRISNYLDLSGRGGLRASARWHKAGAPIVYTASSPASALLEVLVHLELNDPLQLPSHYQLLKIVVPDTTEISTVEESSLEANWRANVYATRGIGDSWLRGRSSALLAVPSAIVPDTKNYLLNPQHPEAAKISIAGHGSFPFDFRLFK